MDKLRKRELSEMKCDKVHYYCRFCGKPFMSLASKTNHEGSSHKKLRPHSCDECGKQFYKKFNLVLHKQKHCGSYLHSCNICDKKFKSTYSVKTHMKIHSNSRPFMCEICGKVFRTLAVLESHNNMHTKQKHYRCCLCEKSYTYRASLFLHMRTHSGERPYQCKDCDASFLVKSHLTDHVKIHTGVKPFECKYCNACFARKITLKKHLRSHLRAGVTVDFEEALLQPQCKTESSTLITSMKDKHSDNEKITKNIFNDTSKRIVLYRNLPSEVNELVTFVITCMENEESLQVSKVSTNDQKVIVDTAFDSLSSDMENKGKEAFEIEVMKNGQETLPSFSALSLEISKDQQSVLYVSNGCDSQGTSGYPKAVMNPKKNCNNTEDSCDDFLSEKNQRSECVLEEELRVFDICQSFSQSALKRDGQKDPCLGDLKNKKCTSQSAVTELETVLETACGNCFLLKCKHCFAEFTQLARLKTHIELHKEYQCKNVYQNISSKVSKNWEGKDDDFTSSLSTLPTSHVHNCDICGKGYTLRSELRKHSKVHSNKHKYFCQKCKNTFQTETFLMRHSCVLSDQFSVSRPHSSAKPDLINNLDSVIQNENELDYMDFEICEAVEESDITKNGDFDYCQPCTNYLLRELSSHCHWLLHPKNKLEKTNNSFEAKDQISWDFSPLEATVHEGQRDSIKHAEDLDKHISNISTDVKDIISFEKVLSVPLGEYGMEVTIKTESQENDLVEDQQFERENFVSVRKCPYCPMVFKYKSSLETHERIHTGEKPFECSICKKSFSKKSNLKVHQQTHTRKQSFLCDYCGKYFSYKSTLDAHKHIHTMELPFTCNVCGKAFRYESSRHVHLKRHMGIKPFKCDFCSKGFVSKIEMEDHKRIHTKEKPYQCEDCGRSYRYRHHLNNHLKVHTG